MKIQNPKVKVQNQRKTASPFSKGRGLFASFRTIIGIFLVFGLWSSVFGLTPVSAISDVTPAKPILNPVTQTLYLVDNSTPQIKVFSSTIFGGGFPTWEAQTSSFQALPSGSKCYGLAVSSDGTKLYASINQGASSKIRVYNLSDGLPYSSFDMTGAYWSSSSSPAGLAFAPGKLYVADKGIGRIRVFNTTTNSFEADITDHLAGQSNLFDVAVTPPLIIPRGGWPPRFSVSYKIYVSQKVESGKIYVFNYLDGTISYEATITGLTYPLYLEVVGDALSSKLFVAVNGTDGVDIKVYNTADNSLIGNVKSGVSGSYGWTAFDVSSDGNLLLFKKAKNASETQNGLYKIDVASISMDSRATELTSEIYQPIDGLVINQEKSNSALTYSVNGNVKFIWLIGALNHRPHYASNFHQYKSDGTEIPKGGTTNENRITLTFDVFDPDGDHVIPRIKYGTGIETILNPYRVITGEVIPSGSTAVFTIEGLADGDYQWIAQVEDTFGFSTEFYSAYDDEVALGGSYDFYVRTTPSDTTPPAAITDLRAAVGTNAGEVRLDWTAVGDDGNSGTASSYIVKYSYTGPITTEAQFNAATTYSQSWAPKAAGQPESYTLTGLTPGEQIWISIKAQDEVPNVGPLGNCAATIVKNFVAAPVITKVYPQRGPNDRVNHIVIIGENLYNDMTATIGTTPLLNVHQDSPTMVQADIPAGVAPGTYEITITCPGGTYDDASHTNPNNNFTVITPGSDAQAPTSVNNFQASDGEDGQSTLTWTNPADSDLREVVILRKVGSYPTAHNDATATQVYQTMIPEPGASVSYIDTGLTNGTTYYYAVFSRDTSDNWNDTVTAGRNADTGTPGGGPVVTISNLNIVRDADTVGSSVTVSWQTSLAGSAVDIYTLTCNTDASGNYTSYFTTEASRWTKAAENVIINTYTDNNQVGVGTAKYYKIVPAGHTLTSSDLTSEVVGKFDISVGPADTQPEKLFISIPLAPIPPRTNSLTDVFGNQVSDMDSILTFNMNKEVVAGSTYSSGSWSAFPGATAISEVQLGRGYGYLTMTEKYLTVVGKVLETDNSSISMSGGWDAINSQALVAEWIGNAYPMPVTIASTGLTDATSQGTDPTNAGTVYQFDANAELIGGVDGAAINTSSGWKNFVNADSPMQLIPGKGYMLNEPVKNSFNWAQPKPY